MKIFDAFISDWMKFFCGWFRGGWWMPRPAFTFHFSAAIARSIPSTFQHVLQEHDTENSDQSAGSNEISKRFQSVPETRSRNYLKLTNGPPWSCHQPMAPVARQMQIRRRRKASQFLSEYQLRHDKRLIMEAFNGQSWAGVAGHLMALVTPRKVALLTPFAPRWRRCRSRIGSRSWSIHQWINESMNPSD